MLFDLASGNPPRWWGRFHRLHAKRRIFLETAVPVRVLVEMAEALQPVEIVELLLIGDDVGRGGKAVPASEIRPRGFTFFMPVTLALVWEGRTMLKKCLRVDTRG